MMKRLFHTMMQRRMVFALLLSMTAFGTVSAQSWPSTIIWIFGLPVSPQNCDDITSAFNESTYYIEGQRYVQGGISYDPTTNTLTLVDASLVDNREDASDGIPAIRVDGDLNIRLVQTTTLYHQTYQAFYTYGNVRIYSDDGLGGLVIWGTDAWSYGGEATIDNCGIIAMGLQGYGICGDYWNRIPTDRLKVTNNGFFRAQTLTGKTRFGEDAASVAWIHELELDPGMEILAPAGAYFDAEVGDEASQSYRPGWHAGGVTTDGETLTTEQVNVGQVQLSYFWLMGQQLSNATDMEALNDSLRANYGMEGSIRFNPDVNKLTLDNVRLVGPEYAQFDILGCVSNYMPDEHATIEVIGDCYIENPYFGAALCLAGQMLETTIEGDGTLTLVNSFNPEDGDTFGGGHAFEGKWVTTGTVKDGVTIVADARCGYGVFFDFSSTLNLWGGQLKARGAGKAIQVDVLKLDNDVELTAPAGAFFNPEEYTVVDYKGNPVGNYGYYTMTFPRSNANVCLSYREGQEASYWPGLSGDNYFRFDGTKYVKVEKVKSLKGERLNTPNNQTTKRPTAQAPEQTDERHCYFELANAQWDHVYAYNWCDADAHEYPGIELELYTTTGEGNPVYLYTWKEDAEGRGTYAPQVIFHNGDFSELYQFTFENDCLFRSYGSAEPAAEEGFTTLYVESPQAPFCYIASADWLESMAGYMTGETYSGWVVFSKVEMPKMVVTEAWTTYYNDEAVMLPEGVTAAVVTTQGGAGSEESNSKALMLKANAPTANGRLTIDYRYDGSQPWASIIPAHTPVLINTGDVRGDIELRPVPGCFVMPPTDNLLRGTVSEAMTTAPYDYAQQEVEDVYFYELVTDGDTPGFYWQQTDGSSFTAEAHKAYLAVPKAIAGETSAYELERLLAPTAIEHSTWNIEHGTLNIEHSHSGVYDLTGRRLDNNGQRSTVNGQRSMDNGQRSTVNGQFPKGVYIVNGRKVVR